MNREKLEKNIASNLTIDLDVEKYIEITLLDIKKYANQRVIEELEESIKDVIDYKEGDNVVVDRILSRLISLKLKQYKELCVLFDVSQQSEPFINFAKEVIEYYEQHDIGDEDIYNKAKKLINGG